MNKSMIKWIISASIVGILTVLLVVFTSMFTLKTELAKYFGANVELTKEREISELKDFNGKRYQVKHENKDYVVFYVEADHKYGQIDFWVVIKPGSSEKADAVVERIVEDTNNQDFISQTYYFMTNVMKNTDYKTLKNVGSIAGSTTSISNGLAKDAMLAVLKYHFTIVDDPYIDIFGEGYEIFKDPDFDPVNDGRKNVHSKSTVTVGDKVWDIYRISNSSTYDETSDEYGKTVVELVLDADGKIATHKIITQEMADPNDPNTYYSQSPGYMSYVETYLGQMHGKTLDEALEVDLNVGATNDGLRSKTCLKGAIEYLNTVLKGA